ncbi:hypothetical protein [Candidatus Coxiella mudrowiae]|uniref:hypothetical protein n=1 Tax=Candidatus Coxiella mudrowiae TaxID=2054173 RepID=UPI0006625478|nr:hypothetical protein [Candidatus Coxiella mudrowiae]
MPLDFLSERSFVWQVTFQDYDVHSGIIVWKDIRMIIRTVAKIWPLKKHLPLCKRSVGGVNQRFIFKDYLCTRVFWQLGLAEGRCYTRPACC